MRARAGLIISYEDIPENKTEKRHSLIPYSNTLHVDYVSLGMFYLHESEIKLHLIYNTAIWIFSHQHLKMFLHKNLVRNVGVVYGIQVHPENQLPT